MGIFFPRKVFEITSRFAVVMCMFEFLESMTLMQLHLTPVASNNGGSICTSLSGVCVALAACVSDCETICC